MDQANRDSNPSPTPRKSRFDADRELASRIVERVKQCPAHYRWEYAEREIWLALHAAKRQMRR